VKAGRLTRLLLYGLPIRLRYLAHATLITTLLRKITDIKVVRGLPHGLNENAIEATKKIRFKPAVKDGKPVSVRGQLEFTFIL